MEIRHGVHRLKDFDLDATRRDAEQAGYTTFVLFGTKISDRPSFFDAVKLTFPSDPPLMSSSNWDALSDSLWEGLYSLAADRIAILWPNTQCFANKCPNEFVIALEVLKDLTISLADPQSTLGKPKEIAVLIAQETKRRH